MVMLKRRPLKHLSKSSDTGYGDTSCPNRTPSLPENLARGGYWRRPTTVAWQAEGRARQDGGRARKRIDRDERRDA